MSARFWLALALVASLCVWLATPAAAAWGAGFQERQFKDDARARMIPAAIWYPSEAADGPIAYSRAVDGRAVADAPIVPGRHPLVILSHGSGGNRFNQTYMGEHLARAGYVVAAIEHPGDRTFDTDDLGAARNLYNRPRDIGAAIDALLGEPLLGAAIDPTRIAVLGHSAGGFAAVVAAGGRPSLDSLRAYCAALGKRSITCPQRPPAADDGDYRDYLGGTVSLKDARVRAAVLFAPAIGPMFDPNALADVEIPVLVFSAGCDALLDEPLNSARFTDGIARATARPLPDIGHFTFLGVCSAFLRGVAPEICSDPDGVDRAAIHRLLASETTAFLARALGE